MTEITPHYVGPERDLSREEIIAQHYLCLQDKETFIRELLEWEMEEAFLTAYIGCPNPSEVLTDFEYQLAELMTGE